MSDDLLHLRVRQLPNGGFVISKPQSYGHMEEEDIGAYSDAFDAHDAIWGLIGSEPELDGADQAMTLEDWKAIHEENQ